MNSKLLLYCNFWVLTGVTLVQRDVENMATDDVLHLHVCFGPLGWQIKVVERLLADFSRIVCPLVGWNREKELKCIYRYNFSVFLNPDAGLAIKFNSLRWTCSFLQWTRRHLPSSRNIRQIRLSSLGWYSRLRSATKSWRSSSERTIYDKDCREQKFVPIIQTEMSINWWMEGSALEFMVASWSE